MTSIDARAKQRSLRGQGDKMTEDQIRNRFEELLTKALNNPQNGSIEDVIKQVKRDPEFKDLNIDLGKTLPGMHNIKDVPLGEKAQVVAIDKDEFERLQEKGWKPFEIMNEELMKKEDPGQYENQARLMKIMKRYNDVIDHDWNLDEIFSALLYMVLFLECEIRYMSAELLHEDPEETEKKLRSQGEYASECSLMQWKIRHDL